MFDVDGVLSTHDQSFSRMHAHRQNKDYAQFRNFFQGDFQAALIGKADLKQLIRDNPDIWTNTNPDTLLNEWFLHETKINRPLLEIIQALKDNAIRCYVATNQERYRGQYIRDDMFPVKFDGYFISGFVGAKKPEEAFFRHVISGIEKDMPDIHPGEILFIDDSPEHVAGASKLGINSYVHTDTKATAHILTSILIYTNANE